MPTLDEIDDYFAFRLQEVRWVGHDGTPWVFLCASAFVEYLAKLVHGSDIGPQGYKDFVRKYLGRINPLYTDFTYPNGHKDLPTQMYHGLRCGLVHSFSLIPDLRSKQRGARERSIVLYHRKSASEAGQKHLTHCSSGKPPNAVVFVAEDFLDDIEKTLDLIFKEARSDSVLENNIISWYRNHPPLTA